MKVKGLMFVMILLLLSSFAFSTTDNYFISDIVCGWALNDTHNIQDFPVLESTSRDYNDTDWNDPSYATDGDWDTYSSIGYYGYGNSGNIYFNYSQGEVWHFKGDTGEYTMDILSDCIAQSTLQLRAHGASVFSPTSDYVQWQCYDGSAWQTIKQESGLTLPKVYEQEVYTFDVKDYFGANDGTLYGKTFNDGTNNGATLNNNLTGTITGATWNGDELEFDGVDDYIEFPENIIKKLNKFTISTSYETTSTEARRDVIFAEVIDGQNRIFLTVNPLGDFRAYIAIEGYTTVSASSLTISPNTNYVVTISYDEGNLKMYVNSILQTGTVGYSPTSSTGTTIGKRTDDTSYLNGIISNFKVIDKALNSTEVLNLYETGNVNTTDYYHEINFPLDEGTGTEVYTDEGKFGGYYDFDGVDNYINTGITSLDTSSPYSISLWLKADDGVNVLREIISKTISSYYFSEFNIRMTSAGNLELLVGNGVDGYSTGLTSIETYDTGNWEHLPLFMMGQNIIFIKIMCWIIV